MEELMAGLGEEVPTEDSYAFTGFLVMEYQNQRREKESLRSNANEVLSQQFTEYTGMELVDPKKSETVTNMNFDTKNQGFYTPDGPAKEQKK